MTDQAHILSISRDVDAPAEQVFALVATPARHRDIDGSDLIQAADSDEMITAVGEVFIMRMRNEFLGDYVTENLVVEFEPDRRIAWEPVLKETDKPEAQSNIGVPAHLRWRWEIAPRPEGGCRVTESYDLSRCPEWLHEATSEGEYWRAAMEASLERLAQLVDPQPPVGGADTP